MEIRSFDNLEAKVNQVVELINRLRSENKDIRLQNQQLQVRLVERDRKLETLSSENQRLRQENAPLTEKREKIKSQIEKMLTKLAPLDIDNISAKSDIDRTYLMGRDSVGS